MNHPVTIEIATALMLRRIKGFRGAPRTDDGWDAFADELQAGVVSVEHMQAVLQTFDEEMPTIRQIRDVAANLRPKFEVKRDQMAEYRRQYGAPEAFGKYPLDELAMHWQAFRDILYYTEGPAKDMDRKGLAYWDDAKLRALDPDWGNHGETLAFIREQARQMGWGAIMELRASPVAFPYSNPMRRRSGRLFQQIAAPITQADIDRAIEPRKTTQQVDADLDSWDDPDR